MAPLSNNPENLNNVEFLQQLAMERSEESRNKLVAVIKDLLEDRNDFLTDREKNLMFKIIETLIGEIEVSLRVELSRQLATHKDVPQQLLSYLANDDISVAYPVLTQCDLINDRELISVIRNRTEEYQLAITIRRNISEEISEALVETGNEDVILNLLKNKDCKIKESTMNYLVEQSKRYDTFQDPLVHHHELKQHMAEKLFTWVSGALRKDIISKFDLPPDLIKKFMDTPNPQSLEDINDHTEDLPEATKSLIKQLKDQDLISTDVMISALNQGEIPLFLGLFVELTKLNLAFSKDIIFDGNGEEIAVACIAIDATEFQFLTIYKKTRKKDGLNREIASQDRDNKLLTFFRTMERENAIKAIATWNSL